MTAKAPLEEGVDSGLATPPRVSAAELGAPAPGGGPHLTIIRPGTNWTSLRLRELWEYRELLYFLVWRDVKVRYKQTALGVGWAVLQPVLMMIVFTVVFGNLANIPSEGLPYPVFTFAALLPWTYFSRAVASGSTSVVGSASLISKIYFPRLIIPLASTATPLVDFFLGFLVLAGLMVWYGVVPTAGIAALPLFLLLALLTALGTSLWLSALNVRYRDVGYIVPFLIQVWMFLSPIVYSVDLVPERWQLLYSLNPLAGVIEGFRWALLGTSSPNVGAMLVSTAVVLALLVGGFVYFRRTERSFADVI